MTGSTAAGGTTLSRSAMALSTLPARVGQVDLAVADADRAGHQDVLADELLDELAERRAGERHVVARPLRHRLEALDELVVPEVLEQRRLLRDLDRRRLHVEAAVEHVGRDVAGVVDEVLGVQPALAQRAPPSRPSRRSRSASPSGSRLRTGASSWPAA